MNIREIVAALLLVLALVWADQTRAQDASSCLDADRARGATYGTADFVGAPWVHTWSNGSTVNVPGEDLEMGFANGDIVRWRNGDQEAGVWADNLTTLQRSLGAGTFTAVRLRDGSAFILNKECKESWLLFRNDPTTPVATDGTVVVGPELECLAEAGILTFESIEVDENGFRLDDPIRKTGGWAMSFGPGDYVVGVDTWGRRWSFNTSDGVCG